MRQKKHNDKRRNIESIKNNQTAPSAVYKRIKRSTKDYKKSNYDNQTNNKDKNRVTGMSIGLEEKKSKPKHVDQKEEKPSSPLPTSSSTLQPEVFDSSRDNAMSEMKEVAVMKPDNTSKVFSNVEEKQKLDPSTISINDSVKKANPENSPKTNPAMANPTLEERDRNAMELKEEDLVPKQDVKPDTPQVHKESEKQDNLGESVRFYDNENKESHSNLPNNDKNNNPFISGIKLWQAYSVTWINAYNEFMKAWMGMIKS
ncbi:MAG: hypothetical protein WBP64_00515 [Nitrososphaeraceae archaeon]